MRFKIVRLMAIRNRSKLTIFASGRLGLLQIYVISGIFSSNRRQLQTSSSMFLNALLLLTGTKTRRIARESSVLCEAEQD